MDGIMEVVKYNAYDIKYLALAKKHHWIKDD